MQRREVIHYHALLGGSGLADVPRLAYMDEWNETSWQVIRESTPPRSTGHQWAQRLVAEVQHHRNKVARKNANK
jgi:hypothetical protein